MPSNVMELAEQMVTKCPECGSRRFRVVSAKVIHTRSGFLLMDTKEVLRVQGKCSDCDGSGIFSNALSEIDFDGRDVQAHRELRAQNAKRRREMFGLDD